MKRQDSPEYQVKIQRQLRLRNVAGFAGLLIAAIAICGFSGALILRSFQAERRIPYSPDLSTARVSTLTELAGNRAYPEALTIGRDGYIYSGSFCTGEIWRISPDGALETWLPSGSGIEAASGMTFDDGGVLYVIDRIDCDPRRSLSAIRRVWPDKRVEDWAQVNENQILNGLTFDQRGVLYATDTQLAQIYSYDANGQPTIWWEAPAAPRKAEPTGIMYDAVRDAIIVADSRSGTIYRVAINPDGLAGEAETLYSDNQHNLDGLTLDDQGRVIFTSYDENAVLRLESDRPPTILARNFRQPSDVAFLEGRIYVTNFDGLSLAPLISIIIKPSLPFTIDVIDLNAEP